MAEPPPIFPHPREMELSVRHFVLDHMSRIVLPVNPSAGDLLLSRFLINELSDHYDLRLETQLTPRLPGTGRLILMGSIHNPLIREY